METNNAGISQHTIHLDDELDLKYYLYDNLDIKNETLIKLISDINPYVSSEWERLITSIALYFHVFNE